MTRIVYFGLPVGALALAEAGHPPCVAIVAPLDVPGRRRLRRRLGRTLLLGRPETTDASVLKVIRSARPERILSYFYPRKIPPTVLALAPAMGTHPSLLPRWRGPDPYFWTIRSGDTRSGVTLHRLDEDYDTGAILESRSLRVGPDENAWSLARRLDRLALPLMLDAATRSELDGHAQSGELTLAPEPTDEQLTIDWTQPANEIDRLVRASAPNGAYATLGETDVDVLRVRVIRAKPKGLRPGEAWPTREGWAVRCGRDAVLLEHVEHDGERVDPETLLDTD